MSGAWEASRPGEGGGFIINGKATGFCQALREP